MSFLAVFVALLIERFFDCSHLRNWSWYEGYQRLIHLQLQGKSARMVSVVTVVPLVLLLMLIEYLIGDMSFGFVKLAFSIGVILFCLGPRNLWADTFACLSMLTDAGSSEFGEKLKADFGVAGAVDQRSMQRQWLDSIFIQANVRVFAIIFWYGMVGLPGVLLYRLTVLSLTQHEHLARQVKSYLDWPAVRVLAFMFALGGNFNQVLASWREQVVLGPAVNEVLLTTCGSASLPHREAIDGVAEREAINLFDRSLVIAVVVMAVFGLLDSMIVVIDDVGQQVQVARPVQRIVSLAPNITEMLYAAGAGQKIVGVMRGSDYPAAARSLPQVGVYSGIDLEKIVLLHPDLVVTWASVFSRDVRALKQLGIPVYISNPQSLRDIPRTMEQLGSLAGTTSVARQSALNFSQQLEHLQRQYQQRQSVTVFYQIGTYALMTVNKRSWINQVIALCGGRNVFADMPSVAAEVSEEAVVRANPQVIVSDAVGEVWKHRWQAWPQMVAVREGRLNAIAPDLLERPGPRLMQGAERLCGIISGGR